MFDRRNGVSILDVAKLSESDRRGLLTELGMNFARAHLDQKRAEGVPGELDGFNFTGVVCEEPDTHLARRDHDQRPSVDLSGGTNGDSSRDPRYNKRDHGDGPQAAYQKRTRYA